MQLTTPGSRPDLQPTQPEVEAKSYNLYSVTTSGLPAAEQLVAGNQVTRTLITGLSPLDEVLLLDVEVAIPSTAPVLSAIGARAVEDAGFILPNADAQAISHYASIEPAPIENASPFEAPQRIRTEEENARQLMSREASGAFHGSGSSAGAVAPLAELAPLVQDRSAVGAPTAFPGQGVQGSSVEVLPVTVATQARAGGTTVGSLPLQISTDALVSVRLADLISLFEDRMDRPLFVWLKSSSSANEFVTFDSLRSAGIDAQYDPGTQQVALSIAHDQTP